MHLSVARLCLDCQEIHDQDRCPVCTSEAFGFMTRWLKVDEGQSQKAIAPQRATQSSKIETYRQILQPPARRSKTGRWLRNGGLAFAVGYLARWGWQVASQRSPSPARRPLQPVDEKNARQTSR